MINNSNTKVDITVAGKALTIALKDIINASGNYEPYDAEELDRLFTPVLVQLGKALNYDTDE